MGNASAWDWYPMIGKHSNPLETVNTHTHTEEGRPEIYSPGESSRKVKEGQGRSRQGQDNPSLLPVALVSHFSSRFRVKKHFIRVFGRSNLTMAAISDKEALAYLLEQVLQADADAPVTLALE